MSAYEFICLAGFNMRDARVNTNIYRYSFAIKRDPTKNGILPKTGLSAVCKA